MRNITPDTVVRYGTESVDGLDIFFRKAGTRTARQSFYYNLLNYFMEDKHHGTY
jgi:hypothetical protein